MNWPSFLRRNKVKPGVSPPRAESQFEKEVVMAKELTEAERIATNEAENAKLRKAKARDMVVKEPEPAEE